MQQRIKPIIITLLISVLVFALLSPVYAAEGEDTTPDETNARGPGAIILMVGIASIGLVGFAYSSRKSEGSANHTN